MIEKLLRIESTGFRKYFTGFLFVVLILGSCKSLPIASVKNNDDFSQYLFKYYDSYNSEYFSAEQIDITVITDEAKSIKAKVYIDKGDYIFINVVFFGFEIGRLEITPDSIKFINRVEKKYFFGEFGELSSLLQMDLNYVQIESLLLKGLISDHPKNRKKFVAGIKENADNYYVIYDKEKTAIVKSYFNKSSFDIDRIEVSDAESEFFLVASMTQSNVLHGYPDKITVNILAEVFAGDVEIKVGRVSDNKPGNRDFLINSKYQKIEK